MWPNMFLKIFQLHYLHIPRTVLLSLTANFTSYWHLRNIVQLSIIQVLIVYLYCVCTQCGVVQSLCRQHVIPPKKLALVLLD